MDGVLKTVPKLCGAYCLVWTDTEEGTFNMIRNKERPMFTAKAKGGGAMLYASEEWMLHAAFNRNGLEMESKPKALEEDRLFSWSLDDLTKGVPKPRVLSLIHI